MHLSNLMIVFSSLRRYLAIGVAGMCLFIVGGCQTTSEAVEEAAKKRDPGNPAYSWVNGKWTGADDRFEKAYWMRVVDGNKIIGREESCRRDNGSCSGRVPLWGKVVDDKTLDITYDKTEVQGVGRMFHQQLIRANETVLFGPGFELKKAE